MIMRLIGTFCLLFSLTAHAQYYYKDIVTSKMTMDQLQRYRKQQVKQVKVLSFENTGEPTADFSGNQSISNNFSVITTDLKSPLAGESELTTHFNAAGKLVQSMDTTDGSGSVSDYVYDAQGRISRIMNVSTSAGNHKEMEEHQWTYDAQGRPVTMLRIKNNSDSTYIDFVLDDSGNVAEENSRRNGKPLPSFYYYYDNQKRLTDVVSYSNHAKRLLPLYIFEYNSDGMIHSMMVVPEGSDDYQKWIYEYNPAGLKTKEICFNKKKQIMGRIEYEYQ